MEQGERRLFSLAWGTITVWPGSQGGWWHYFAVEITADRLQGLLPHRPRMPSAHRLSFLVPSSSLHLS